MTAKRTPRYWAQWGRMRHYVANVATTDDLAHHLLDRRIQVMKLQYSLGKKVENERKAGARIRELKAENEWLTAHVDFLSTELDRDFPEWPEMPTKERYVDSEDGDV